MAKQTVISERRRKVWTLKAIGMTDKEIAQKLGISRQTIWTDMKAIPPTDSDGRQVLVKIHEPTPVHELAPVVQKTLEFSVQGFERFFNRYSDYKDLDGNRSPLQPHSRRFVEMALASKRVVINVPVAHAKSSIFSVWMVLWLICRDRNNQIVLLSKTNDQAMKFCREIAHHLENNDKLVAEMGRFVPEKNEGVWSPGTGKLMVVGRQRNELTGDLTLLCRGATQGIYGIRATHIIADDMVDTANSLTLEQRTRLSEWFHIELLSRLEPTGRVVVVGTRFHLDDIYGELSRKTKVYNDPHSEKLWTHINFPALSDPDTGTATSDWERGVALWPERWPVESVGDREGLHDIFNSVGPIIWNQTWQQEAIPPGARLVQPEWVYGGVNPETDAAFPGCVDRDRMVGQAGRGIRVISLDPSPSRYAAMIVADVQYTKGEDWSCDVLEIVRRRMAVRDMLDELERLSHYGAKNLIIEVNAAQKWFAQDSDFLVWAKQKNIRLIPHTTGKNKADPDLGVESLAKDFYFGRIHLPYADSESVRQSELLITEALNYIPNTPRGGVTDDVLMAMWFIRWNRGRLRNIVPLDDVDTHRRFHIPERLKRKGLRGVMTG